MIVDPRIILFCFGSYVNRLEFFLTIPTYNDENVTDAKAAASDKVSVEKRSRGRTGRTSRLRSLVKMPLWN